MEFGIQSVVILLSQTEFLTIKTKKKCRTNTKITGLPFY